MNENHIQYSKLFDFKKYQAKQLENSSYLEDLTGLIKSVASNLDEEKYYYFDDEFYLSESEDNNSFSKFIDDFKKSFYYNNNGKINIIRGIAGVGKSLFFKKGIQKLIRDKNKHKDKYIPLCIDFKNIDSNQTVLFYSNMIYNQLKNKSIQAIIDLNDSDIYNEFNKEYSKYKKHPNTYNAKLFPAVFFSKEIRYKYKRPCIIVFDNIDLANYNTQVNVFKATINVCNNLDALTKHQGYTGTYCVYFAMRPETQIRNGEGRFGDIIQFPLPNILAISLKMLEEIIFDTAKRLDKTENLKCEVTFNNIITNKRTEVKKFIDVAKYFNDIFQHYLKNLWNRDDIINRLGKSEEFHCNIVNYNIRTFLIFLSDTLSNGGFLPLTKDFNKFPFENYYTVFDYIEMIIRGKWLIHPGNRFIDSEGNNNAPIVFNVFDTRLWDNNQENKTKHFMLFIRILQYFNLNTNETIKYMDLKNDLKSFFDKKYILLAVKQLTFISILKSDTEGDSIVADKNELTEVDINDKTKLSLSPKGKFYIEKFIYEFEYLYQMALSSIMPDEYTKELESCWEDEKEYTVLLFLKGIFTIIKKNINSYKQNDISLFINLFCIDDIFSCKPFRRMLHTFVSVMTKKVKRAETLYTNSLNKLLYILNEAKTLENEANNYFLLKLDERSGDEVCL